MNKIFTVLLALLFGAAALSEAYAQLEVSTNSMTLFSIGKVNHYDTYLSPMEYTGPQLTFLHETHRNLKRNYHILFQTWTQGEFSYAQNRAETAHELGGSFRYDAGWHREWLCIVKGLDVAVGGLVGGDLGMLYNARNGNNPAQARANLRMSASFRAFYHFRVKRSNLSLCYQACLPVLGMAFSPQYGQSYYNIFDQGNYDHNIRCTHFGNALSLRQTLIFNFPVRHATLSVGYLSDLRQAHLNGLKQHQYTRGFVIGYSRKLTRVKNERLKSKD